MKKFFLTTSMLLFTVFGYGQIVHYNQFPTLKPNHILDSELTNISFAFSMRVLESDYNGSLIRLRRASDNSLQDFGWASNDIVDINAINTWRAGSNVYVHTWYDQSGLGRNAVQTNNNRQPRFYPNTTKPYFAGDGNNDYLIIDTPNGVQDVTNAGNEGTVLAVMRATRKSQFTFGVNLRTGGTENRWSAHINWVNDNAYFDPGFCCNNTRYFSNNGHINVFRHYTFIKTSANTIARRSGVEQFNASYDRGHCTLTSDFTIGWANGNYYRYATTGFTEFIMYRTDINATLYQKIENNSRTFWSLP